MSDLQDPNDKPVVDADPISKAELPPYRQSTTLTNKPASKFPLWMLPVLAIVLVIGVLVGKYWGNHKTESDEVVAPSGTQSDVADKGAVVSNEQAVLSVETVVPSQDSIGNTLSADGTIAAKDIANVSARVNGVAIERILVEEGQRVKAGQILAVFDTAAMEQQVLQAEADVAINFSPTPLLCIIGSAPISIVHVFL